MSLEPEKEMWSEIRFAPYPYSAAVFFDEPTYDAFCDSRKLKDKTWIEASHLGDVCSYDAIAVVRINDLSELEDHTRIGIFAHEATHVFQALCKHISESTPSEEFQAYMIQSITEWLFKEYECFQLSTSSSSEQPSLPQSSEDACCTSAPSEATLPNQEPESQSLKECLQEAKRT